MISNCLGLILLCLYYKLIWNSIYLELEMYACYVVVFWNKLLRFQSSTNLLEIYA